MSLFRKFKWAALVLLLLVTGCSVLDKLRGKKDDNDNMALLLLAAVLGQSGGCQNQSGLVICIPPGLRQ